MPRQKTGKPIADDGPRVPGVAVDHHAAAAAVRRGGREQLAPEAPVAGRDDHHVAGPAGHRPPPSLPCMARRVRARAAGIVWTVRANPADRHALRSAAGCRHAGTGRGSPAGRARRPPPACTAWRADPARRANGHRASCGTPHAISGIQKQTQRSSPRISAGKRWTPCPRIVVQRPSPSRNRHRCSGQTISPSSIQPWPNEPPAWGQRPVRTTTSSELGMPPGGGPRGWAPAGPALGHRTPGHPLCHDERHPRLRRGNELPRTCVRGSDPCRF